MIKTGVQDLAYWANQMTPTDYAGHFHVRNTTARSKNFNATDIQFWRGVCCKGSLK